MTTYTNRFKLPLLENGDVMSLDSFNQPHQMIDDSCLGFKDFASFVVNFDNTGKATVNLQNVPSSIKFIQIFPEEPSNEENWKTIARASIRAYVQENVLNLQCQGVIPNKSVTIHMVGYY